MYLWGKVDICWLQQLFVSLQCEDMLKDYGIDNWRFERLLKVLYMRTRYGTREPMPLGEFLDRLTVVDTTKNREKFINMSFKEDSTFFYLVSMPRGFIISERGIQFAERRGWSR